MPLSFDCRDPLQGRYMTLQKYDNEPNGDHQYLDVFEVDVEIYCSPILDASANCPLDQNVNMCHNEDLITESKMLQYLKGPDNNIFSLF